jgi:hypothetical protein
MGITSGKGDDDLEFEEVSFRAQTYLKTVWDIFQVCAALLPDYIVAVRPFEERSTVFYGKPHWLYTSGVIPLTTGVTPNNGPKIAGVDLEWREIMERLEQEMAKTDGEEAFEDFFNDISSYTGSSGADPSLSTAGMRWTGQAEGANLAARAVIQAGFVGEEAITMIAIAGAESGWRANVNNAGTNRDGSVDHGMWQINESAHRNWVDFSRISDPFYNAEVAFKLVQRKKDAGNSRIFGDWAVHEHYAISNPAQGKYRQHLPQARAAYEQEIANLRQGSLT